MSKGGWLSFFGWGKKDTEKPEYQGNPGQGSAKEPKVMACSSCGAKNLVAHSVGKCDFCGSLLSYTETEAAAAKAQSGWKRVAKLFNTTDVHTLSAGFYTPGIDIPVGTCNVTAISGLGNLYSNGAINESFGAEKDYLSSFKGLKLRKGICLKVSGALTIKLAYQTVDEGFSGRTYDMSSATDLSAGNYNAGIDFATGIYTIAAVSGLGNLSSRDAKVNESFGIDDDYTHEIKNVNFPEGAEFSISGALTIKMIPEDCQGHTEQSSIEEPKANDAELSNATDMHTLSTGFYTPGIDIPVGTCNVAAVSGSGYLSCDEADVHESFGVDDGDVSSFNGLKLRKDACLEISGELTIDLVYRSIEKGFSGRTYDMTGAIDISTGNYDVGTDFAAGIYTIVAVSGSGYLSCDNPDLGESFGFDDGDVREIKNVNFPEDTELSLSGALTIKLIPEDCQGHTEQSSIEEPKANDAEFSNATDMHTLSTGFYIPGIDIPVGTCNVAAVSGSGYLSCDDPDLGESFGVDDGDVSSFNGLKLRENVCLKVLGELTIDLVYRSIEKGGSGRTYDMTGAIDISTGNYDIGTDFAAGIYTIVAVSGSGYLSCAEPDLGESFGVDNGDIHEIKHVNFPKGAELSLSGDLTIKMIPEVTK